MDHKTKKNLGLLVSDITTIVIISIGIFYVMISLSSCKHEPVVPDDYLDQTNTNGGGGGGGQNGGIVCDPDSVYFNIQVLPLLISNCAMSGCHDAATAQDGVILDSYSNVMSTGDVDPFDPWSSDLFEVLLETDPDKKMPPPPANSLTQQQINLIQQWISQGAQNLNCDPNAGVCDSTLVSFSLDVDPIIQTYCKGCHNVNNSSGGVNLDSYIAVQTAGLNGSLVGAITHSTGYVGMPYNSNQLSDCNIGKIRNWVSEGALNN
jgi:hypothetical protein